MPWPKVTNKTALHREGVPLFTRAVQSKHASFLPRRLILLSLFFPGLMIALAAQARAPPSLLLPARKNVVDVRLKTVTVRFRKAFFPFLDGYVLNKLKKIFVGMPRFVFSALSVTLPTLLTPHVCWSVRARLSSLFVICQFASVCQSVSSVLSPSCHLDNVNICMF